MSEDAALHVTVGNYVRAESDFQFREYIAKLDCFGRLNHARAPYDVHNQVTVRGNRDTLYSFGVFDLTSPLTVQLPDPGNRYQSLMTVSQDHSIEVCYSPAEVTLTAESVGTRFVFLGVRTFADPGNDTDLRAAHALQDRVSVQQAEVGVSDVPAWDQHEVEDMRNTVSVVGSVATDSSKMFGIKEELDPVYWLLGAAVGWGGLPGVAATYGITFPDRNDGQTPYTLRVADVPVDAFWSVTLYDSEGWMPVNDLDAYSYNGVTAEHNADGSVTIHFGGDPGQRNFLPIVPGWNYIFRAYRPRKEILDGSWTFPQPEAVDLTEEQFDELVRRSYQYVAMFNVNNKFALDTDSPSNTGGYNRVFVSTELFDHRVQSIARPNNDTLYAAALIDVTEAPMVLKMPAFDSTYVSLMVTAYDHYVNIPLSTVAGDFGEPSTMLFYSARTPNYDGAQVEGVDHIFELTGDFASAVFRIMPHAAEPERLERNRAAMRSIDLLPLSEFLGAADTDPDFVPWGSPPVVERNLTLMEDLARFPEFGSDFEIFEDRFLEVMQFVFNHTTFDADDPIDQALLAAFEPLGVVPGMEWDAETVADLDGVALRATAEKVAQQALSNMADPSFTAPNLTKLFQPKGKMELEFLTFQSVVGPIGVPATQAVYPPVLTEDGAPMNAMFDYEIVIAPEDMPPANAFWSTTLYDNANGFFIPNDRFKYSVGENAGFKLDEDGGIRIVIAADQPEGVPEENWLPVNRGDYDIDVGMRIYAPDLVRFTTWTPPVARKLN